MVKSIKNSDLGKGGASGESSGSPAQWRSCGPAGRPASLFSDCCRYGTWNVRGLNEPGKLHCVIQEIKSMKVDVMGLAETFWQEAGEFTTQLTSNIDVYKVIYSGAGTSRKGVAVVANKRLSSCIQYYDTLSDRIIALKLQGKTYNALFVQCYAPPEDAED